MVTDHYDLTGYAYYSLIVKEQKMDNDKYFSQVYMPKMNRLGKITGYLGVLFSFIPVSYLAWQYGLVPSR